MTYSVDALKAEIRAARAGLDNAGNSAQGPELDQLREAIHRLTGTSAEHADELGRLADRATEETARARQALADSSAALSDYQTHHVERANGRIGPAATAATAVGVGKATFAVAAAIAAAGIAKTSQLIASAAQSRNQGSGPATRSRLTREFNQARAESLEKNSDVRRNLGLFKNALKSFFKKHEKKIDGLLKVADIAVPLAGLLVAAGFVTGGGAVALIAVAPFYLASAKFAVQMVKHGTEHGFKHDGKTYLMVGKEALKLALAADVAKLAPLRIGTVEVPIRFGFDTDSKVWATAAVAAADSVWKIIESHNRRGFRLKGQTFFTTSKETYTAALALALPALREKWPVLSFVCQAAGTACFNIVEKRPVGGIWWKKKEFFKAAGVEVFKSAVGAFLKEATQHQTQGTGLGTATKDIEFKHLKTVWELRNEKIPETRAYFKKESKAYQTMANYFKGL